MIAALVKATLIVALALCACPLLRRASAAARYLLLVLSLGAFVAIPLFTAVLPPLRWRVLPERAFAMPPRAPLNAAYGSAPVGGQAPSPVLLPGMEAGQARAPVPPQESASAASPSHAGAASIIIATWLAGVLVVLAALLASARRVRRLRLHAREASPQLARLAAGTPLLVSEKAVVPMTWGLRRPFILLPAGAESWSDERLRAVLLHERAHIVRRDLISLAFINAVAAMAWFHPLVWLARARALELCEEACDDAVVRGGVLGSRYAEELVAIARTTEGRRIVATTAILPARSALPRRIAALVSASRSRREVGRRSVALAITASFLLFGPLAAMRVDARPSTRIATPQALVELERSLAAGFDDVRALRSDPKYAPWQNDPRFRSLLALASELELMQPAWRNDRPDGDEQARWTPAVAAFKRMTESRPDLGRTWFNLGYALHARGDEPQAIDAFRQALDRGYRPGTTSYNIACAFARLGRNDDALRWLAHARDSGFDLRPSLATDRDLDALRTDPRLAALDR